LNINRISTGSDNSLAQAKRHVGAVLSVRGAEARIGVLRHNGTSPEAEGTTVGKFLTICAKARF